MHPRIRDSWDLESQRDGGKCQDTVCKVVSGDNAATVNHGCQRHTDSGHDLSFQPKLILEAPCKITDPTPTVTADIRHPPDVIEHVSGCEQEHGDQAQTSPYITILDNGHGVRVGDGYERDEAKNGGCDGDKVDPVEGAFDRRLRSMGKLSRDPRVDGFGRLRSENALGTSNAADVHDTRTQN